MGQGQAMEVMAIGRYSDSRLGGIAFRGFPDVSKRYVQGAESSVVANISVTKTAY
jgi:hypothetical protein